MTMKNDKSFIELLQKRQHIGFSRRTADMCRRNRKPINVRIMIFYKK